MTDKESRALEIWISENIFGAEITHTPNLATDAYMQTESDKRLMMPAYPVPRYTSDNAAAMTVLEKIVEETEAMPDSIYIGKVGPEFVVGLDGVEAVAETLPLAIALFARDAKKLFSK